MSVISVLENLRSELPANVKLVAVSKFHPVQVLEEAYGAGQRVFGENRPQEFASKVPQMPSDVEWHFIGHLQTNKLKFVLPYANMVESVDSMHLLRAIDSWCGQAGTVMNILLELHLGAEETKHGFTGDEIEAILDDNGGYPHVRICGLMGMATHTSDVNAVRADFEKISGFKKKMEKAHPELTDFKELSIGMSGDYEIALEYGSTIVRIGTKIFGPREY
ncbi:MAG: YggS family pyridoxal phosphate-dependent enzyme [Bacteroidales bacterium]|jgi:pyridoxal phosphate enzyme (YggS family)|nr:YggS family pyridoxal phosphate-dependent enzyme [Bacteroidales bacterium]MCI1786129.1 YggS family pyridoxal phosphate-dependent enzyme [Bacteroidales bacterium]